jgi:hypothetical protein
MYCGSAPAWPLVEGYDSWSGVGSRFNGVMGGAYITRGAERQENFAQNRPVLNPGMLRRVTMEESMPPTFL